MCNSAKEWRKAIKRTSRILASLSTSPRTFRVNERMNGGDKNPPFSQTLTKVSFPGPPDIVRCSLLLMTRVSCWTSHWLAPLHVLSHLYLSKSCKQGRLLFKEFICLCILIWVGVGNPILEALPGCRKYPVQALYPSLLEFSLESPSTIPGSFHRTRFLPNPRNAPLPIAVLSLCT